MSAPRTTPMDSKASIGHPPVNGILVSTPKSEEGGGGMIFDKYARFLVHKSPAAIDAALRSIIHSAYAEVSHFRDKLDAVDITPEAIQSRRDLPSLPMTSRDEFLDSPASEYTNRNADLSRCYKSSTSGTTGIPLDIYMSRSEAAYRKLVLFTGIRRNVRCSLPFRIVEVGTGEIGITRRRQARRFDPVPVYHIARALPIDEQLERLIRARPHVITGHPSCLESVAEKLHRRPPGFAPRLVVCRGELLRDSTRSMLRETFGCKIVDYYSCDEIGNIAWECPVDEHKLHINTDGCVVEIVDESGAPLPAETEGLILVTNLFNRTMPFVRYRLGDRGSLVGKGNIRCSCGYAGPSLALLAGREDDYYWLPDGRRLSPRVIDTLIGSTLVAPGTEPHYAKQYQCIQETRDTICVLVLPADHAPGDLAARISKTIEGVGAGIRCRVEFVEAFPPSPSGKHRSIMSKVET